MEILHVIRKGKMMNTLERLNICIKTQLDNQINDKCMVKPNIIFDIVIQGNTNTPLTVDTCLDFVQSQATAQ
jgi:hypothetical protein